MRVTIERLRFGILVLAGALVVGILLFFAYARWQVRRIGRDLPGKLGIEIQQSSQGFAFSKSHGGHTLFTLHAAKTIQYKGTGHATLNDVSITLYGVNGAPADHIYGKAFDYDPVNGIVRADGAVEIDLQAIEGAAQAAIASDGSDTRNTVHIKTSDLVFNQRTGVASTLRSLEFRLPQASGTATGASFDSNTGVLILASDVAFESSIGGSPLSLRARHAQYDRAGRLLYLLGDETEYAYSRGSSDQATVYFRPDGSAARVEAQGHVTMVGDRGQRMVSPVAHVALDRAGQPQQAVLDGGLLYTSDDALRSVHCVASSATMLFAPRAALRKAELRTAVSIVDEEKPQPRLPNAGRPYQSLNRQVQAGQIDIDFSAGPDRRPIAQQIRAAGAARMQIRTVYPATAPEETSIEGDHLIANLQNGVVLSSLEGAGHTKLALTGSSGSTQSSTGDMLLVTFAAQPAAIGRLAAKRAPPPSKRAGEFEPVQLQTAEQTGDVTLIQTSPAPPPAQPRTVTATAQRATYDAATQLFRLYGGPRTGDPRVRDLDGELTARTIEFERASGDANASGHVAATYRQSSAQPGVSFGGVEPVHVVADRARLDHATDLTVFYGGAHEDARLWQGADSISAPVLELSRSGRTLDAHGSQGSDPKAVAAVFTGGGFGVDPGRSSSSAPPPGQDSVIRVSSRSLVYSDSESEAVFDGGVVAQAPLGVLRASVMEVYLDAPGSAGEGAGHKPAENQAKQVERIVARQGVEFEQPGRKGSGERLVYTAQDGHFVLTGSSSAPPRLSDQAHGTVTGSSLIFNDRDDSVIVSGGRQKAVTETRTAK